MGTQENEEQAGQATYTALAEAERIVAQIVGGAGPEPVETLDTLGEAGQDKDRTRTGHEQGKDKHTHSTATIHKSRSSVGDSVYCTDAPQANSCIFDKDYRE